MGPLSARAALIAIAVEAIVLAACGSTPAGPSDADGLTLSVRGGEIRYVRWAGGPTVMEYRFCYEVSPSPGVSGTIRIQKAEVTIVGASGTPYNTSNDLFSSGTMVHGGLFGCPTVYSDPDVARPLATTYRLRLDYVKESSSDKGSVSASGTFVSRVPRLPLMSGLTVTHDIADPQQILRRPTPVTFVATGVGGIPPYQFRWTINGFALRDWSPDPVLVWDAASLAGGPLGNRTYTLLIQGRSDGNSDPEAAATVDIRIQY